MQVNFDDGEMETISTFQHINKLNTRQEAIKLMVRKFETSYKLKKLFNKVTIK